MFKTKIDNRTPFRKAVDIALAENNINFVDLARELGYTRAYIVDIVDGARKGQKAEEIKKKIQTILNIEDQITA